MTWQIPVGTEVAIAWAKLMHVRDRALAEDAWVARTARHDGDVVVTRNARDFEDPGVPVLNPFQATCRPVP